MNPSAPTPAPAPAPIGTAAEAERAIANLNAIMDRLVVTVEEETAQVRAGRLRQAVDPDGRKSDLARAYAVQTERLMAAQAIIAEHLPEALDQLRQRHAAFRAMLQINLTVLATAHAVSEGIVRGVSGELARKQAPSTYGASGRANAPSSKASQPLAISREL